MVPPPPAVEKRLPPPEKQDSFRRLPPPEKRDTFKRPPGDPELAGVQEACGRAWLSATQPRPIAALRNAQSSSPGSEVAAFAKHQS